ncbi:MAG: SOS response-associated peptidase [Cyanothece sp. SIO1E1]|nr:SOS response-associated peptidase [Cyanothece sp. SIO1E1]
MCGRFSLVVPERFFSKVFVFEDIPEMQPNYNIPPGVDIWAIRSGRMAGRAEVARLRWGLVPSWAKDPKIGNRMINARSETVSEKPAFRSALGRRRCLIPADGFYEWKREGKIRTPFRIHLTDHEPFAMAGLWESWQTPDGDRLDTCTILTTSSNQIMQPIHDRMPVILNAQSQSVWLNPATPVESLKEITVPYPAEKMAAYPVSTLVNSPRNNGPECLEKQDMFQQTELF